MTKWFPISKFIIYGHSMQPFLNPGNQVVTFNWAYIFLKPKVGDVVVFKKNTQEYIKRVQKVNDNEIFVIGDNQEDSLDSRKLGLINKKEILGKVIMVV